MEIICRHFDKLSVHRLYDVLQLRSEVFVLEQRCIYQDMDNVDKVSHHLMLYEGDQLMAYARLIPSGVTYQESSIGRILTRTHGQGHGALLMDEALKQMELLFGVQPIRIGAQVYARAFYEKFGFVKASDEYDDTGIPHIYMIRQ